MDGMLQKNSQRSKKKLSKKTKHRIKGERRKRRMKNSRFPVCAVCFEKSGKRVVTTNRKQEENECQRVLFTLKTCSIKVFHSFKT